MRKPTVIKVIEIKNKTNKTQQYPQKEPDEFCREVGSVFANLVNLHITNEEHKQHFKSPWYNISNIRFDRNPLPATIDGWELLANDIHSNKESIRELRDLCASDPYYVAKGSLARLSKIETENEKCIELMFYEILIWNMLAHFAPTDNTFYKYTAALIFRTGEVLGRYCALKDITIRESKERQKRPKGRGDKTRLVVMEEAEKLRIKSSNFGQKERDLKKTFIGNVNGRLSVALDSQHILSVLRKGLAERKR